MDNDQGHTVLAEAALGYLKRGWSVIPVYSLDGSGHCTCGEATCQKIGKHPRILWKPYERRRPGETEVSSWWQEWPDANIGLICGSVSGWLAVLDIDDPQLAQRLLMADLKTRMVRTPSGGLHVYLRETAAASQSGPLVNGVADLKARGGYVVAPPSLGYALVADGKPLEVPDARAWAVELLRTAGVGGGLRGQGSRAYQAVGQGPLREGVRNSTLTSLAGLLRRAGLDAATIEAVLQEVNTLRCQPPLSVKDVTTIAHSVGRYTSECDSATPIPMGLGVTESKWVTAKALLEQEAPAIPWLWQGYLAPGLVTLLSARPKTGKTTWLFHLLRALFASQPFLGYATQHPGKVLLLTEEGASLLRPRLQLHGLAQDGLLLLRRHAVPNWLAALDQIQLAVADGVRLVVIDTLAAFWGVHDENDATAVGKALLPIQRFAQEQEVAILLLHHLRKAKGDDGTAHRGSGALVGAVDVAVEMGRIPNQPRRRMLQALSRLEETPTGLVIELAEGSYSCLGPPDYVSRKEVRAQILATLPRHDEKPIPREDRVHDKGVEEGLLSKLKPKPSPTLLKEVLSELVKEGLVQESGRGVKGDPCLYRKAPISDSVTPPPNSGTESNPPPSGPGESGPDDDDQPS